MAFPATHDSMSAASERGWLFAEQPDGIVAQLDHGIRVLLIDAGTRLVVLMENRGGGDRIPWLIQGFDVVRDTPYLFASPADLTCDPNRGDPDASLFLVNHWIDDWRNVPRNSATVNARDVLPPRLRECEDERGQPPNLVAVGYYDRGDLLAVGDELNGF